MQDGLHKLAVVFQDGRLAGVEAVRFCPAETEAHLEISLLGAFVVGAGILGDVEAGDADAACGAYDRHERVEDGCRGFSAILSLGFGFEADGIDRGVYFGSSDYGFDEIAEVVAFCEIDRSEADLFCVLQAVGVHVSDHDKCSAEDLG